MSRSIRESCIADLSQVLPIDTDRRTYVEEVIDGVIAKAEAKAIGRAARSLCWRCRQDAPIIYRDGSGLAGHAPTEQQASAPRPPGVEAVTWTECAASAIRRAAEKKA